MNNLINQLRLFTRKKFVRYGIPVFVLVVGGSFYLEQFSKLRYQYGKQQHSLTRTELKQQGLDVKDYKEVTLEAHYENMKNTDIDNWEQIRIPRPWDETISNN